MRRGTEGQTDRQIVRRRVRYPGAASAWAGIGGWGHLMQTLPVRVAVVGHLEALHIQARAFHQPPLRRSRPLLRRRRSLHRQFAPLLLRAGVYVYQLEDNYWWDIGESSYSNYAVAWWCCGYVEMEDLGI